MRILADENIPGLQQIFGNLGHIKTKRGADISSEDLNGIDVLLVRSATRVDETLIRHHRPRFIGTATAGTDHVDVDALNQLGIHFGNAPGSNAVSVVEYVLAALSFLADSTGSDIRGKTVGVVGAGQVGGRLIARLHALDCEVLVSDPPLQTAAARKATHAHTFVPYTTLIAESDIVSFHVPLTHNGPHPTYHLLNERNINAVKRDAWIVNAARGEVVSTSAAKQLAHAGNRMVLDVWESEPTPDADLVAAVDIATPHIAGYSIDGKLLGTQMIFESCMSAINGSPEQGPVLPRLENRALKLVGSEDVMSWEVLRQLYPIDEDHHSYKTAFLAAGKLERGSVFADLRKNYPTRRAFSSWDVQTRVPVSDAQRKAFKEVLDLTLD